MRKRGQRVASVLLAAAIAGAVGAPVAAAARAPVLAVDVSKGRHAINPEIYGINGAVPEWVADIGLPVDRWGGDSTSLYNFRIGGTNLGINYFFEDHTLSSDVRLSSSSTVEQFVKRDRDIASATGRRTRSLVTVPMIGRVARSADDAHPLCSFRVTKYGSQTETSPSSPDCGNGKFVDNHPSRPIDPNDATIPNGPADATAFVSTLVKRFGDAAHGGVALYAYDNEPSLWNDTHRDVHPASLTASELLDRTKATGRAVKAADATALLVGPADSGPQDWLANSCRGGLGAAYLDGLRTDEAATGVRLLDYFDEHYYPAATGVSDGAVGNPATQDRRLRSVRSLWDPTYNDESWLHKDCGMAPLQAISAMRALVKAHYPGTRTAMTEYNFGGFGSINGALAQADVLGVFGREGLDLATWWDLGPHGDEPGYLPSNTKPGWFAFRMFRNYDGRGGQFGDLSVRATSSDPTFTALGVHAAVRKSDGALTVLVINKTGKAIKAPLTVSGFALGSAKAFQYSSDNLKRIVSTPPPAQAGKRLTKTYPPNSLTLVVLRRAS